VAFTDLLGIHETINVESVEFKGIVDGSNDISDFNPTTIKLHIQGMSACGDRFFVDARHGALRFFQVGSLRPHNQPGCLETIEYFWTPGDFNLSVGETKVLTQSIGPNEQWEDGQLTESYFTVSAEVTKKSGKFPDGGGDGIYYTYADVNIEGPK
jgi:hypothetical protein